jgi:hypothetical protein
LTLQSLVLLLNTFKLIVFIYLLTRSPLFYKLRPLNQILLPHLLFTHRAFIGCTFYILLRLAIYILLRHAIYILLRHAIYILLRRVIYILLRRVIYILLRRVIYILLRGVIYILLRGVIYILLRGVIYILLKRVIYILLKRVIYILLKRVIYILLRRALLDIYCTFSAKPLPIRPKKILPVTIFAVIINPLELTNQIIDTNISSHRPTLLVLVELRGRRFRRVKNLTRTSKSWIPALFPPINSLKIGIARQMDFSESGLLCWVRFEGAKPIIIT